MEKKLTDLSVKTPDLYEDIVVLVLTVNNSAPAIL